MLSKETLERYRSMSPGQRLALSLHAIDENEQALLYGKKEVMDRRFELLDRENRMRNENLLRGFARTESR